MTAVCGWISAESNNSAEQACRLLLAAQSRYSSARPSVASLGNAAFAAAALGEDGSARLLASSPRVLAVADARLDNRNQLSAVLGLSPAKARLLSDAELLAAAWDRWREETFGKLIGDFAIAIFDAGSRRLFLARDPSGQRALFYARAAKAAAFASAPSGLLSLPKLRRGWNFDRFAEALTDISPGADTYFEGIQRVRPGQCVVLDAYESKSWTWWRPALVPVVGRSREALIDEYRSVLRTAVERRLPPSGPIAAHLSSGYDSSAVAASAALLSEAPILAFTSAPPPDFAGPIPKGRIGDESGLASLTAAQHQMRHHIVRGGPLTVDFLRRQAITYQEPARNLINGVWWIEILRSARSAGAHTVLSGSLGNITLNFGGLPILPEWIRSLQFGRWWRQAEAAVARGDVHWRGVLFNSFAPWLPLSGWKALRKQFLGIDDRVEASFLHPDLRQRIISRRRDDRPSGKTALDRLEFIDRLDPGMLNKGGMAEAAILECDPLADRELIEFSLGLPPEAFLDSGISRPLARKALADRVPGPVLESRLRGVQSVDWPSRFSREVALNALEEIERGPGAQVLDLKRIRQTVDGWPEWRTYDFALADLYSRKLPIALATGIFMQEFAAFC